RIEAPPLGATMASIGHLHSAKRLSLCIGPDMALHSARRFALLGWPIEGIGAPSSGAPARKGPGTSRRHFIFGDPCLGTRVKVDLRHAFSRIRQRFRES